MAFAKITQLLLEKCTTTQMEFDVLFQTTNASPNRAATHARLLNTNSRARGKTSHHAGKLASFCGEFSRPCFASAGFPLAATTAPQPRAIWTLHQPRNEITITDQHERTASFAFAMSRGDLVQVLAMKKSTFSAEDEPTRILLAEDLPWDASLAEREIRNVLGDCSFQRVDTRQSFVNALSSYRPHLVVADYRMPSFDGLSALKLVQEMSPMTPVIILTAAVNEDTAVECMKAGASDYVIKEHLKRLGQAVVHALAVAQTRKRQVEAEAALRRSEGERTAIFNALPDVLWRLSRDGRFLDYRTPISTSCPLPTEGYVGRTVCDVLPHDVALQIRAALEAAFSTGEVVPFEYERTDGNEVRCFDCRMSACSPNEAVAVVRDITDRKRSEAALRASEAQYKKLVETLPEAITIVDCSGIITYVSQSAVKMYRLASTAEGLGTHILRWIHASCQEAGREHFQAVIAGASIRQREYALLKGDGSSFSAEVTASPISGEGGIVQGVIIIVRDVSERKAFEVELLAKTNALQTANRNAEAALAARTNFLTSMSHEIRTPMNGVLGMASLLLKTALSDEQRELADVIESSSRALLAIINDILDLAKIEQGKMHLEISPFDLWKVASDVVELLAPSAAAKGLDLTLIHPLTLPHVVVGDAGRIRQILLNLVSNSVKFTERGYVKASIGFESGLIRFAVEDSGPGISQELVPRLFERLRQGELSIRRGESGLGLGLAICRELTAMMQGSIQVENRNSGGTVVTFHLPLDVPADTPLERTFENPVPGLQALVATDLPATRELLLSTLAQAGIRTYDASAAAHTSAGAEPVSLVILDAKHRQLWDDFAHLAANARPAILMIEASPGGHAQLPHGAQGYSLHWPLSPMRIINALYRIAGLRGHEQHDDPIPSPRLAGNPRVLVAEDNLVNQKVAVRMLERMGCQADLASNGLEALQKVGQHKYDAILMDVHMPELNGYDATAAIRALGERGRVIPIIAMTAGAFAGDRAACLSAGMNDYISKPIDMGVLRMKLTEWIHP